MAGESEQKAGALSLYGASLASDLDACMNRIRNIAGLTDETGASVLAPELSALRESIDKLADALKAHVEDAGNPHVVQAGQVGADISGTAEKTVAAHNVDETAHKNLIDGIATAEAGVAIAIDEAKRELSSHNEDETAHADIRESVSAARSATGSVGTSLQTHINNQENPHSVTEAQVASASKTDADKSFGRLANDNTWSANNIFEGGKVFLKARTNPILIKGDESANSYDTEIGIFKKSQGSWSGTGYYCAILTKQDIKIFSGGTINSNCLCLDKSSGTIGVRKGNTYSAKFSASNIVFLVPVTVDGPLFVSGNTGFNGLVQTYNGITNHSFIEFAGSDISVETDEGGVNYLSRNFGDSYYHCDISSFAKSDGGIVNMLLDPSSFPNGYKKPEYGFIESTYHITNMTGEYDCTFSLDTNRISDVPETSIKFVYGGDTSIYENIPVGGILVFTIRMTQLWITETDSPAYFVFVKNQGVFSI